MSKLSLTEATILALQGKLTETVGVKSRSTKRAKKENINVNIDTTSVDIDDNTTVINTDDATVVIDKKDGELDNITPDTSDVAEIPMTGDETIIPETLSTTDIDADLPMDSNKDEIDEIEENKKVEGYIIKINKDGIDGYWGPQSDAINNNNNVDRLSARIFKSRGAAQREINRYKHEMGNAQIEEIEENKKIIENQKQVDDGEVPDEAYSIAGFISGTIADKTSISMDEFDELF